jgi:hypothetical protein
MRLELDSFKTKGFIPPRDSNLCPVMAGRSNTARQPVAQKTQLFGRWLRGWRTHVLTYAGQAINLLRAVPTYARRGDRYVLRTILPPKFIE